MFKKEDAKQVIVKKSSSGSTYKTFVFECSECKTDIKIQSHSLKIHSGKCRRCVQKGKPYEHILNELTYRCKNNTNHYINLSYEEFLDLIKTKRCHYCNKKLEFNPHTRDENNNYTSRAYQLDRKDNNKGYTKENCVPCCWDCNRIKSNIYTYEEFLIISKALKKVYKNRLKIGPAHPL